MKYRDALLTQEWKLKRNKIISRDNYKCTRCNESTNLQVHHTFYFINQTLPWNYPDDSLVTLCGKCHTLEHKNNKIKLVNNFMEDCSLNWTMYDKNRSLYSSENGRYKLGNFYFSSKSNITKFNRSLLNELIPYTEIIDINICSFVYDLYKFHHNYDNSEKHNFISIQPDSILPDIKKDINRVYYNFVIHFKNREPHQFSSKKCILNIN